MQFRSLHFRHLIFPALLVLTAAVAFLLARSASDDGAGVSAQAQPPGNVQEQANPDQEEERWCETHPIPGGGERTTCADGPPPEELWYYDALLEDSREPWFDGTLNGIRIGPDVSPDNSFCESIGAGDDASRGHVPFEESAGTPVEISPAFLPQDSSMDDNDAFQCGGVVIHAEAEFTVPPDLSVPRAGGFLYISRSRGTNQVEVGLAIAARRASAGQIAGRPAVVFEPVLPEGLGTSAIVIDEPFGTTVLVADGLPGADLRAIAESLYAQEGQVH